MLDTNILSYLAKEASKTLDDRFRRCSPDEVCISVVTEAEQLSGFERFERNHRIRRVISDLMESLDIAPWDSDAAAIYDPIRRHLELNRQHIGELDTMIAAHAMSVDATLITTNIERFRRVPGLLKLENWLEA